MLYNGPYLRVLSPRTSNGSNLLIDEASKQVQYREDHLPMSAYKHLITLNKSTPKHLQKIIEVVQGVQAGTQANKPISEKRENQDETLPFLTDTNTGLSQVPNPITKPVAPKSVKQS
jgi:hypothetical protein